MSKPGNTHWWRKAGAPSSLISLNRFVSADVFRTVDGGYGATFALQGVDDECLSDETLAGLSRDLLAGQRLVPENVISYYIALKRRAPVPEHKYTQSPNPVVAATQQARRDHLAKAGFCSIDLFLTLYIPPSEGFGLRAPGSHAKSTRTALRQLEDVARVLQTNLSAFGMRRLQKTEICDLYGYIANLNTDYAGMEPLGRVNQFLARQPILWSEEGLRIGPRHAKVFSLLASHPVDSRTGCPKATRPNLFGPLLRLSPEMVLVFETQRRSSEATRKAAASQETFTNFAREKILTVLAHLFDRTGRQQLASGFGIRSASSQSADKSVTGISSILDDLKDGITYTESSLIGLIHSEEESELQQEMAHVHRIAGESQAIFQEESIGALSARTALFPGGQIGGVPTNVRRLWLREDHAAHLSLVYAPYRGEAFSAALEDESAIFLQTRDGVPFGYDVYSSRGVRGCFVMGETGHGKTFILNALIDSEAKYGGYIFIFDVGGGFEQVVRKHGGTVIRFGLDGPCLAPFGLPNTEPNHRYAQRLVKMLLLKSKAPLQPEQETEINERVVRLFSMPRRVRRLSSLILPRLLQPYLSKWIEGGIYGKIFDNVEDEFELQHMVAFDFEGLSEGTEQNDLMEPLLSWIRWRIADYTHDADNLGIPKLEVYDELWRHLKNEQLSEQIIDTTKTGRKHLGGIVMATHSVGDLREHASLIRTNCPDAIFVGGNINREEYGLFKLNNHQLDLIENLKPGEFFLSRREYSKILRLDVEPEAYWRYTSRPLERKLRNKAIAEHGTEAFRHLAKSAS